MALDATNSPVLNVAEVAGDFGKGDEGEFAYWMTQEKIAEREERPWVRRARLINKRYRDERPDQLAQSRDIKRLSILWSNVEVLRPTLYGNTPKADVVRRFETQDDGTARLAATLLERAINYSIETEDFDACVLAAVQDRLLPGRGVVRQIYIPRYGEAIPSGDLDGVADEEGGDGAEIVAGEGDQGKPAQPEEMAANQQPGDEPLREVVFEECRSEYVWWEDYREGPARTFAEVPWVRYRSYLTRDQLIKRFGEKIGKQVTLDFSPRIDDRDSSNKAPPPDAYKKAVVHEYWDKTKLKVCWIAPGTEGLVLDKVDDPLGLTGFYPSPDPLLATTTTDRRIPVPDYLEYQDQALLVDDLTQRINKLLRALRAKGIYAGEEKDSLQRLFDMEDDALLIPVEDFGAMQAKGGLSKIIEWVPIQEIAQTLVQLYAARDKEIQNIYQITGISDILRGETQPEETFGAQSLKSHFASRRILPKQKDVAKFARGLVRIKGDIIARHFSPKTISMITGYPQLLPVPKIPAAPPAQPTGGNVVPMQPGQPNPQNLAVQAWNQQMQQIQAIEAENQKRQAQFDAAVGLMRADALHDFRIDIQTDSTMQPDQDVEKNARTEFLKQIVPFIENLTPIMQGNPAAAELGKQVGMFAVRAFPVSRPLEEAFEKFFDSIGQMPPQQQGDQKTGPDTPQALQIRQQETQSRLQIAQVQAQQKQQQTDAELQADQQKLAVTTQLEREKLALETEKVRTGNAFRQAEMAALGAREAQGLA